MGAAYETVELNERVPGIDVALLTRFRWRAERRCRSLNAQRLVDFYRWEVHDWLDGRWGVVAMQNRAKDRGESS